MISLMHKYLISLGLALLLGACDQPSESSPAAAKPATLPASTAAQASAPAPAAAKPPAVPDKPDPSALIGKPPPPFTVAKWVKGEPLKDLEKGTVYVVDFWATWCGPCKAAIPHLTKLAQTHRDPAKGKVEVVGVSISERQKDPTDTAYIAEVEKFVAKQGERMDYRVAVDTPDKQMHAAWFKPTGTGGIPTAYIIDQKGLVAWTGIGTPAVIERIVGELLAGTFDPAKEAAAQARAEAEAAEKAKEAIAKARATPDRTGELFPGYAEAMREGNTAQALEAINQAFKAKPELEYSPRGHQLKIQTLMQRAKAEEVDGYLKDLLARTPGPGGENPTQAQIDEILSFFSACTVRMDDEPQRYDAKLILEATQRSHAGAKPESRWLGFTKVRLAWAYFHAGDKAKALDALEDAAGYLTRYKDKHDFGDLAERIDDGRKAMRAAGGK